jgi:ABC-type transport system substrate-binding protein
MSEEKMKKIFISVVTILIITVLLSGCGKPTSTSTMTTTATTPTTAASPQGELIYTVPSLGTEDFRYNQGNTYLPSIVYERLFRTNRNISEAQGTYPLLAESYTKSDDGLTYDIFLHHGIQWQGGYGELTADDVVCSFDQIKNPDLQHWYNYIFNSPDEGGYMSSYEAIDRYHVRFHLSSPYNMFLLDMTDACNYIICKKYLDTVGWDEANKHPIGTGPWEWVETVSGDHIKFQAFDEYWGKIPEFKFLTLKLVPDKSTQLMMLQTGEADMAILTPEQAPDALEAGLQLFEVPNTSMISVLFGGQILSTWDTFDPTVPWANHTNEPDDSTWNQRALKVRKALCLSIDPQTVIDNILHGYGSIDVLRDHVRISPNFLPEWQPYPYDPQQAEALLAEAGYPNGFDKPVEVLIETTSGAVDTKAIALYVADCFEAIGLEVDRQMVDPSLRQDMWEFGRQDAWKVQVSVGFGIILPVWGSGWALASWSPMHEVAETPFFDENIRKYTTIQDPVEAVKVEQALGSYEYYRYFSRGIGYAGQLYFFGPKVKNASQIPYPYWQESEVLPFFDFEYIQRAD